MTGLAQMPVCGICDFRRGWSVWAGRRIVRSHAIPQASMYSGRIPIHQRAAIRRAGGCIESSLTEGFAGQALPGSRRYDFSTCECSSGTGSEKTCPIPRITVGSPLC